MRKLLIFALAVLSSQSLLAQIPFLLTETAAPLGMGRIDAGVGFEYLEKSKAPSPENPHTLFRAFVASVRHGVAENVNYDLTWRGGLFSNRTGGRKDFDWGDLSVWTKISVFREEGSIPGFALQSGVKLPNTRHESSRLGSNQMDFHSRLLVSKWIGKTEVRGNIGFAILGDPTSAGSQDDVYSVSAAGVRKISEKGALFGEILAQTGYQDHDEKVVTRFGVTMETEIVTWSMYATARIAGNNRDFATAFEHSETWSVGLFFQRSFHASLWKSPGTEDRSP